MNRSLFLLFTLVATVFTCRGGEPLAFSGGTCRARADGAFDLVLNGRPVTLEGVYISKGWGFHRQANCASATVRDGRLEVSFTPPAEPFRPLEGQPFTVRLLGVEKDPAAGLYRLGGSVGSFDRNSSWGWGESAELMPYQVRVSWKGAASISCWGGRTDGSWDLRIPAPKPRTLVFSAERIVLRKPVDTIAQRREQYRRILLPPQEPGFDTAKFLAVLARPRLTAADLSALEDLFDARSRLASLADRLRHRPDPDTTAADWIVRGYAALSSLDRTGVTNACAHAKARLTDAASWMPLTAYHPFSWVKSFTQWGFMKHPDGVGVYEPTPWNLLWEDGFRMTVAQDARVVAAHPGGKASRYLETRYLEPMSDVHVTRSWTDTRWTLPDRTVTFSLLSPVVDVDGVETLTLGGFPSAPYRLEWATPAGTYGHVQLTGEPAEGPEIIPSVLMDFAAPPPSPEPHPRGQQKIDPASVGRPWLRLRSTAGWSLALLPDARPVAAKWEKGVFSLSFERRCAVGVLRLRDNLHPHEQPEVMEFFARQHAAWPIRCLETVTKDVATWRYAYRTRDNAWGLGSDRIAPVPPLCDYADCPVEGARKFKYPTKWGIFRYVSATEATARIPDGLREPGGRGVNVSVFADDAEWELAVTNGASWVRACLGRSRPLADAVSALEDKLRRYGPRGLKVLVDPHGLGYEVGWQKGAVPASDADYLALWDVLSRTGARHAAFVAGYDLYNEPGLVAGSEARWRDLNERAAATVRRNHPGARICHSAVYGGNPNGLFNLVPLAVDAPQSVTFHFYTPHSFTHQKCQTHNAGGDTCVFYPGWAPAIDWTAGHHFGGTTVDWFDKWTLAAAMLPAFEHLAEWKTPLHCGEFSVIGYANAKSPRGAFLWTRDVVELLEHAGISWHLWNGGFGLGNPFVRDYVFGLWPRAW